MTVSHFDEQVYRIVKAWQIEVAQTAPTISCRGTRWLKPNRHSSRNGYGRERECVGVLAVHH